MSTSFKDTYYRDLIDRALDDLRDNKELSIGDIISDYQRQGDDIASDQFYPYGTNELEEEQVNSYLSKCLREHNTNLVNRFRVLADSIKEDVKREISKNLQNAVSVIDGMKTSFADNLKKEGDAYLSGLEKDMEEKTVVLKKIETIITCLSELSTLYQ